MRFVFAHMGSESLAIESLAAALQRAGHEVGLVLDHSQVGSYLGERAPRSRYARARRRKIVAQIVRHRPDVVGFSCVSSSYPWSQGIARELRAQRPKIRMVAGGVHVTSVPDKVATSGLFDALLLGEADETLPGLLADWEQGRREERPGVWRKDLDLDPLACVPQRVDDLDALPFADKDIFYEQQPVLSSTYRLLTSRGCPFSCSYCFHSLELMQSSGAGAVRRRSVENVIEELRAAKRRHEIRLVKFEDDIFVSDRRWLTAFAAAYEEHIGLPYYCNAHPSLLNPEGIDLLARSGCSFVTIGVQSVDPEQRRRLGRGRYDNERVAWAVGELRRRGIMVSLEHILGLPGDTEEKLEDACRFYTEVAPDRLLVSWLTYYPRIGATREAVAEGRLTPADVAEIEEGHVGSFAERRGAHLDERFLGKAMHLLTLAPLLPSALVLRLLPHHPQRWLPDRSPLPVVAMGVKAVLNQDPLIGGALRVLLARKVHAVTSWRPPFR